MKAKLNIRKYLLPILLALVFLAIILFPYYYLVLQSFVPWVKVDKTLVPKDLTIKSFSYLFTQSSSTNPYVWARSLLNSFIVSLPTGIISVLVGLFTGYASSKMNFSGKKLIYNLLVFQMFFPTIILLVPRFMIMKDYVNSYVGLILPLCIPIWAIFMYINYFKTIPDTIFEAARIDGASELQNVLLIAMPATKPISVIVFLTSFTTRWTEVIWDMKMASDVHYKTLNVMLTSQFSRTDALPGPMYASAVALTLPIILLFLAFSKYFREGINFMVK